MFLPIIACIIILLGIFQTENTVYVNDAHCLFLPTLGFLRALLMLYLHCFAQMSKRNETIEFGVHIEPELHNKGFQLPGWSM